MSERDIVLVMKDDGGTNNILPICRELIIKRGRQIKIFTNGRASERLKGGGLEFMSVNTTEEILANCNNPALLITSMCTKGGVGRDLVPILHGTCPVVAVQDYWGCQLVDSWRDSKFRPDYITVNDQLGADLILKAWPEFDPGHICKTGFPASDWFASINLEKEKASRREIRTKLNTNSEATLIFFPCGIITGASQMLAEILMALEGLIKTVWRFPNGLLFIPRVHPKLKMLAPEEFEPWNNLLIEFDKTLPGIMVFDESVTRADINTLLVASDVVVSDYSTSLFQAGLIGSRVGGKVNISVMYPEVASKEFKSEFGGILDEPPFVTMGCTAKAENRKHLTELLVRSLFYDELRLILGKNQSRYLLTDGKNTQKVVDFLDNLLNQNKTITVGSGQFAHVSRADIVKAVDVPPVVGKRMIPPFDNFKDRPFGIVEDHKLSVGLPEVHVHEDDLWIGLEGEAIFTGGGDLVEPYFYKASDGVENRNEIKGKDIVGGERVVIGPGDVLWIPAGVPHMHTAAGTARLIIYKSPKRN